MIQEQTAGFISHSWLSILFMDSQPCNYLSSHIMEDPNINQYRNKHSQVKAKLTISLHISHDEVQNHQKMTGRMSLISNTTLKLFVTIKWILPRVGRHLGIIISSSTLIQEEHLGLYTEKYWRLTNNQFGFHRK